MVNFTDVQLYILEKEQIECQDVISLLDDLHDNDLPLALRERLEEHLQECEECRAVRDGYEMTISLAHELGEEETPIPNDVHNRLCEALNSRLGLNLK